MPGLHDCVALIRVNILYNAFLFTQSIALHIRAKSMQIKKVAEKFFGSYI